MRSLTTLPSMIKMPGSPILTEFGIFIDFDEVVSKGENLIIQGMFVLPIKQDVKVYGEPHKSLVLTVTATRIYAVETPFTNVIGFMDDIEQTEKAKTGYFQLNISSYIDTTVSGVYYILCSVGIYLSNILQITVK